AEEIGGDSCGEWLDHRLLFGPGLPEHAAVGVLDPEDRARRGPDPVVGEWGVRFGHLQGDDLCGPDRHRGHPGYLGLQTHAAGELSYGLQPDLARELDRDDVDRAPEGVTDRHRP